MEMEIKGKHDAKIRVRLKRWLRSIDFPVDNNISNKSLIKIVKHLKGKLNVKN